MKYVGAGGVFKKIKEKIQCKMSVYVSVNFFNVFMMMFFTVAI